MCAQGRPLKELAREVIQQALYAIDANAVMQNFEVREIFERDAAAVRFHLIEGKTLDQEFSFEELSNATTNPADLENRLRSLLFPASSSAL